MIWSLVTCASLVTHAPSATVFRRARPEESADIAVLRVHTFCGHLRAPYSRYLQQRVFEESMAAKTATVVAVAASRAVAGEAGPILGCADLLQATTASCYVTNVAVHAQARRRGIARGLMRLAEAQALSLGGEELVLHVEEDNAPALALYEAIGFAPLLDEPQRSFFSAAAFTDASAPPQRLLRKRLHATATARGGIPSMSAAAAGLDAPRGDGARAGASPTLEEVASVAEAAGRAAAALVRDRVGTGVLKTKATRGDLLTAVDGEAQEVIEAAVRAAFPAHAFLGEESVPAGATASADALRCALDACGSDWLWVVDPLDGTTNFVQSLPLVGVSIGVARRVGEAAERRWEVVVGVVVDPFREETVTATLGGGCTLNGSPVRVGVEPLADAVVATGFAPTEASLAPMVRGIAAVGARARTVRMLGSAAIMLAWVACGRLSAYFEADLNAWDSAAGVLLVREAGGLVSDLRGGPFGIASRPMLASNAAAHAELREVLRDARVLGLDPL